MSEQDGNDEQVDQRRDAILRRLLQKPPQSRAQVAEAARRATEKPRRGRPTKLRKPA